MLPRWIKWPVQFAGFVLLAWAILAGFNYGLSYGGWVPAVGGALLAFGLVGLGWFVLKMAVGRVAEWLVLRTIAELEAQMPKPEGTDE